MEAELVKFFLSDSSKYEDYMYCPSDQEKLGKMDYFQVGGNFVEKSDYDNISVR